MKRIVTTDVELGFPVHAGIDLRRDGDAARRYRIPRTRGDRPVGLTAEQAGTGDSPYTRG